MSHYLMFHKEGMEQPGLFGNRRTDLIRMRVTQGKAGMRILTTVEFSEFYRAGLSKRGHDGTLVSNVWIQWTKSEDEWITHSVWDLIILMLLTVGAIIG